MSRPQPSAPRSPALHVVAVLFALFFVCGTCHSCDGPAPTGDAMAATPGAGGD